MKENPEPLRREKLTKITRQKIGQSSIHRVYKADVIYLSWLYNILYAKFHLNSHLKKQEEKRKKEEGW